jgi:HEAT repeat protein
VRIDSVAGLVRYKTCANAPCTPDSASPSLPITLDRARFPLEKDIVLEVLAIGQGKSVVHARVPEKGGGANAWEAVLAAGERAPIFAGMTGLVRGDPGDRTGAMIDVVRDGDEAKVLVADLREDLRICGQARTPLAPRVLDPATLTLFGATMQRLSPAQREGAERLTATSTAGAPDAPIARLVRAVGSSVPNNSGAPLTDGNPSTVWTEQRPGDGHGEFVVMALPSAVPVARLAVTFLPPASKNAPRAAAAPRTFYLVTDTKTYAVTIPSDARPGQAFEVAFREPFQSACLTFVLDEAYTRDQARPDVTVAELSAYSVFDAPGTSLETLVAALAGGAQRAQQAAALLKMSGDGSLKALEASFEKLDAPGRRLAADVATSLPNCATSGAVLVRAMLDPDTEVARKGRSKLENPRCGRAAAPKLIDSLRENEKGRPRTAPLLATLSPAAALEPLAEVMAQGGSEPRAAVRDAFATASRGVDKDKLLAIVMDPKRSPDARLDLLRAVSGRVNELPAETNAAIAALLEGTPSLRTRYFALEPLSALARAGDAAAAARLSTMVTSDPDWPVRARAAELLVGIPSLAEPLAKAARDPEPRVREAALRALGGAGASVAVERLANDPWTFVREAAVATLTAAPRGGPADEALTAGLKDSSPTIRAAAAAALGTRRVVRSGEALRDRLDDREEDPLVRAAAARALGATCHKDSLDRLTKLAREAASPVAEQDEATVGAAAIDALGKLHPSDLRDRLAPLFAADAPPLARRAAEAATQAPPLCNGRR